MTIRPARGALAARVARELATPAPAGISALVDAIQARFGDRVDAILFYGACRRTGDATGLLDLYVLHDGYRRFYRRWLPALYNRALPPNVIHLSVPGGSDTLRAKVAIMSRRQFAQRMRPAALDTTIWTRFCQPASLLYARNPRVRHGVAQAIAEGVRTAVAWSTRLAPAAADPASRWRALFMSTYRLELRPEARSRPALVYEAAATWFDEVTILVQAEGQPIGRLPSWRLRRLLGKPLNLLRLVKAAFTFEGGADYLSAKLGRHTGATPVPSRWQRRHPLLGAPVLIWQHRNGVRATRRQAARGRS